MLDDLFIQDHYYSSVRDNQSEDNRYIVFRLQPCNKADKTSFERRSLFWYKMGEISRVVFSVRMLVAGSYNNAKVSSVSETVVPQSTIHRKILAGKIYTGKSYW